MAAGLYNSTDDPPNTLMFVRAGGKAVQKNSHSFPNTVFKRLFIRYNCNWERTKQNCSYRSAAIFTQVNKNRPARAETRHQ